jgi:hypothetical protein
MSCRDTVWNGLKGAIAKFDFVKAAELCNYCHDTDVYYADRLRIQAEDMLVDLMDIFDDDETSNFYFICNGTLRLTMHKYGDGLMDFRLTLELVKGENYVD